MLHANRTELHTARDAGVDAELCVLRDTPHNGPLFAEYMPEGARALAAAVAHVRDRLAHTAPR